MEERIDPSGRSRETTMLSWVHWTRRRQKTVVALVRHTEKFTGELGSLEQSHRSNKRRLMANIISKTNSHLPPISCTCIGIYTFDMGLKGASDLDSI